MLYSGLEKAQEIFKEIDFEGIDLSELLGGWTDTSEDGERMPSIGWPDVDGEILINVYFNGRDTYNIVVITDGGVKETYDKKNISEVNLLLLWLLVREDCIKRSQKQINRSLSQKEMYDIITKNVSDSHSNGFKGEIDAGEILYGGDISVEVLEFFGMDPYKRY